MASLLEGQIAKAIYAGFKGKLLTGTLRREIPGGSNDEHGDPETITVSTYDLQGFADEYSDAFKAQAGIPVADLKVCIFAQSLSVRPAKDDQVRFGSTWYQLRKVATDPATALWTCQAFEIPEPIDVS